jgi:hypothetical protein
MFSLNADAELELILLRLGGRLLLVWGPQAADCRQRDRITAILPLSTAFARRSSLNGAPEAALDYFRGLGYIK